MHPSDVLSPQRIHESGAAQPQQYTSPPLPQNQQSQQGYVYHNGPGQSPVNQHYSPQPPAVRPNLSQLPIDTNQQGQVIKPSFTRGNTEVKIVDESAPNSPAGEEPHIPSLDDGITLADIPQIMEAAQAREQQRSLPRQNSIPYIAELSALELAIVKHSALLALVRSPLREQFDLDELLEMVEAKKSTFWNKLFKGDKKNVKKKGAFVYGIILHYQLISDILQGYLAFRLNFSWSEKVVIPYSGQHARRYKCQASSTTLSLLCGRWVSLFLHYGLNYSHLLDMSVEGIFRKNGNIRRIKDSIEAIDRDPSSVDLSQDNPVQLAALLKKFLRDLPDPLMTFKLHRLFIASQS